MGLLHALLRLFSCLFLPTQALCIQEAIGRGDADSFLQNAQVPGEDKELSSK
jgi:hypothetical protein